MNEPDPNLDACGYVAAISYQLGSQQHFGALVVLLERGQLDPGELRAALREASRTDPIDETEKVRASLRELLREGGIL